MAARTFRSAPGRTTSLATALLGASGVRAVTAPVHVSPDGGRSLTLYTLANIEAVARTLAGPCADMTVEEIDRYFDGEGHR